MSERKQDKESTAEARALAWDSNPDNWMTGSTQGLAIRAYKAGDTDRLALMAPVILFGVGIGWFVWG